MGDVLISLIQTAGAPTVLAFLIWQELVRRKAANSGQGTHRNGQSGDETTSKIHAERLRQIEASLVGMKVDLQARIAELSHKVDALWQYGKATKGN